LEQYAEEFDDPLWQRWEKEARTSGHGGADFFVMREFLDAVRNERPAPIDAYDAAAWSCIIALAAESICGGNVPVEIPDFTKGRANLSPSATG
jgi:hypothetical protein